MSQEINLINPALRPRRDWVASRSVALGVVVAAMAVVTLYAYARYSAVSAARAQTAIQARLTALQQEVQVAQAALAARVADPALETESQQLSLALKQRGEVLSLAESLTAQGAGEVAEVMRGFSRQRMEGVWLTAFSVGPGGFDIRGRLLDPALLPGYIRRLNSEPAFRGRSFAALDMQGVSADSLLPAGATPASTAPAPAAPQAVQRPAGPNRFTEFALRATISSASRAGGKE